MRVYEWDDDDDRRALQKAISRLDALNAAYDRAEASPGIHPIVIVHRGGAYRDSKGQAWVPVQPTKAAVSIAGRASRK